ncbi:MAG TPA: ROK family protein [Acidimicrobiales bacterium]|nr:ROK family protein [Acidimicrobiales bacterium]
MTDVAIGIDVGGTKALALLVASDGRVLGEVQAPTPHDGSGVAGAPTAFVLAGQVRELCSRHDLDCSSVPIGLGLPGLMRRDGRLAFAPNLRSASGADIGSQLGESLASSRVFSDNDANCAALAEHEWGAASGIDDFVMVTLGTGIGGGVFADGHLLRGRSGFAGEIGHMVVQARGVACSCGGYGCWERYVSGGGLQRLARQAALEGRLPTLVTRRGNAALVSAEDVTAAAAENMEEAVLLIKEIGWWLALGLANLAAILDCGHFVIGGGLSTASDLVLPAARDYVADLVEGHEARPAITITPSMFGPRSGAMGAALVAFERSA